MAVTAQQTNALITFYVKEYTTRFGHAPDINRYREKWGFQAMLEDLGVNDAKATIEFYLNGKRVSHPLMYLLRNYDNINRFRKELLEDEANRAELRKQTEKRVKEFEDKYDND